MTVHVYPNVQSVIVFCIEFSTSVLYMEREENRIEQLYIHVLKGYAHIGSLLSSFYTGTCNMYI